mgnify:FL=1
MENHKEQYLHTLTEVKRRADIRTFDPECSFANTTTKLTKKAKVSEIFIMTMKNTQLLRAILYRLGA